MRFTQLIGLVIVLAVVAAGVPAESQRRDADEPDQVTVQHFLISFKRKVPGKVLERTKKEALALAEQLLKRAQDGEDFDALVKEYTDDRYPGKIVVINDPDAPIPRGAVRRRDMVARFGDVAFSLEIGEIGFVKYHAAMSPYGWHVVKRLE